MRCDQNTMSYLQCNNDDERYFFFPTENIFGMKDRRDAPGAAYVSIIEKSRLVTRYYTRSNT